MKLDFFVDCLSEPFVAFPVCLDYIRFGAHPEVSNTKNTQKNQE